MTPYLGQLMLVSFGFAPKGWAMCNGQLLPINQNQALFSLLGTTFGGNGQTTFALPDLRSRAVIASGMGHPLGERAGAEGVTVIQSQMPPHNHIFKAISGAGNATKPGTGSNAVLATSAGAPGTPVYTKAPPAAADSAMAPNMVSNVGGSQPHENRPPFLVLNWIIALQGIFPSQN